MIDRSDGIDPRLRTALERARTAGFLGPGDLDTHLDHALGFARVVERALEGSPRRLCDLGTGGGPPGLILAARWPEAQALFVEANQRRARHLDQAVAELGMADRVTVVSERAEAAARDPRFREQFDAVTARGFAAPAVTAEIAAGFVAVSGVLVTSEPPEPDPARWPEDRCVDLGFAAPELVLRGSHYAVLRKTTPVSDNYPRAVGRPGKRPLW